VTHRTRIIFTTGAVLLTFAANPFNTCILHFPKLEC